MKNIALVVSAVLLVLILGFGLTYVSISNQEIQLVSRFEAQEKNVAAVFDNTWKTIQQVAQVSNQYKEAFAEIYPKLITGRYNQGELLKFVTESNPTFDTSLYNRLVSVIESNRATFTMEQKIAIDIAREQNVLVKTFPGSLFVGGRPLLVYKPITSDRTEDVVKTRKDNDIKLF